MGKENMQEMKDLIRDILGLKSEAAQDMSVVFAMALKTGYDMGEAAAQKNLAGNNEEKDRDPV